MCFWGFSSLWDVFFLCWCPVFGKNLATMRQIVFLLGVFLFVVVVTTTLYTTTNICIYYYNKTNNNYPIYNTTANLSLRRYIILVVFVYVIFCNKKKREREVGVRQKIERSNAANV